MYKPNIHQPKRVKPLGGSLVILTPFCSTVTGNAGDG